MPQQRQAGRQQGQQQADRQPAGQQQHREGRRAVVHRGPRHLDGPGPAGHRQRVLAQVLGLRRRRAGGPQRLRGIGTGAGDQRDGQRRTVAGGVDQAMVGHLHLVGRVAAAGQGLAQQVRQQQHPADLAGVGGTPLGQRLDRRSAPVDGQAHQHAGALLQQRDWRRGLRLAAVACTLHHLAAWGLGDVVVAEGRLVAAHRLVVGHGQVARALARRVNPEIRVAGRLDRPVGPHRRLEGRPLGGADQLRVLHRQQAGEAHLHPLVVVEAVEFVTRHRGAGAEQGLEAGQQVQLVLHPLADVVEAQLAVALELVVGLARQEGGAGLPGPQADQAAQHQQHGGQRQRQAPAGQAKRCLLGPWQSGWHGGLSAKPAPA